MILCCGEALIDMIPQGSGFVPHVGGSVLNTAVAMSRLGTPSGLMTGLSSDPFGQMIEAHLNESNVDYTASIRSERNTTLAFVHLDSGEAEYSFYDEQSATLMLTEQMIGPLPETLTGVFFGGISLCNAPVADTLAELAMSQPKDRLVMVDFNIRPGFAKELESYHERLKTMVSRADLVKLSLDDLNWLMPGDESVADKAAALRQRGAGVVLITSGAAGATAFWGDGRQTSVAARQVEVVDTVGAGDTFNAGCLSYLHSVNAVSPEKLRAFDDRDFEAMLSFAAKAASITVTRAGANSPWAHELDPS